MKRFKWVGVFVLPVILLAVAMAAPDAAARASLALCDEVDAEPVVIPNIVIEDSPRPQPRPQVLRLRGAKLEKVKSLLAVRDAQGASCLCTGDYQLRFLRFGVPLTSFRAHLRETPAHLNGSFGVLSLDDAKAHQLFALLNRMKS